MTKRKSTGKKARFEVFKRDNFTCQYCGARPPEAVLVVDHMTPVKLGGTNEFTNLITSCEPCNQGKAARPLTQIHPRPDADLMYLEVQQEIAELQRFQRSEQAKKQAIDETIALIQQSFTDITDLEWQPHDQPLRLMLAKYDPTIVKDAIDALGRKLNHMQYQGEDIRGMQWVPYMWSVCRNMAEKSSNLLDLTHDDCYFHLAILEGRLIDGMIWEEAFYFLNEAQSAPYMKAWRESISKKFPIGESISRAETKKIALSFLEAGMGFTPLAIEFVNLLLSDRIESPEIKQVVVSSIEFEQGALERDKEWIEERKAA